MKRFTFKMLTAVLVGLVVLSSVHADPCGMVPPIYVGNASPIARIGLQKTYVFHKNGVETFVIRPGFSGKVDNFGMLIPFPNPPELRKVSDNIFEQVANAVDPPEVVVDLRFRIRVLRGGRVAPLSAVAEKKLEFAKDKVTVLKQEAVGMYEVAVLEAGSAAVLKKWMDTNGYKYCYAHGHREHHWDVDPDGYADLDTDSHAYMDADVDRNGNTVGDDHLDTDVDRDDDRDLDADVYVDSDGH
jgi:hypothetical protein